MRYVRSTKEPVLAVVQGPSPHGEQYRTITYKRGAAEVVHDRASVTRKRGKQAAAKPAAASASIPVADGEHVQLFKTLWDCKRKFYTVPLQNKGHAQN